MKIKLERKFLTGLISALIVFASLTSAYCLPTGEFVESGVASFDRATADTLNINTPSDKLIVNYDSFSIASKETVNFNQPSASSIVLNRVTGIDPSAILGALHANGRIFIVNPNGIFFGAGSRVDVAGLVASTLNIKSEDFLNGNYNFYKNGKNSSVVNEGNITIRNGGYVALLSGALENVGAIVADLGKIVLASGEKMTVALDDNADISVVIDEAIQSEVIGLDGKKMDSAIKNSGTISAQGGKVLLTSKSLNKVFDYAINNTGVIQANNVVNHNGVIELVAVGAAISNIGKIEAGLVDIKVPGSDLVNMGTIVSHFMEGLANSGNIGIEALNVIQDGVIAADNIVNVTADNVTTTLGTDPEQNIKSTAVIQAASVRILTKTLGTTSCPVVIDAASLYVGISHGDVEILESLGIGSSVFIRGPATGFGAFIYNKDSNLTLEAEDGSIFEAQYATILAGQLSLVANQEINNEGSIIVSGYTYLYANGLISNSGLIDTLALFERGYSFTTTGTIRGGSAYYDNADGAANIGGSIGSNQSDTGDLNVTSNITLTANNLIFSAGTDGSGRFNANGFSINSGGSGATYYNLTINSASDSNLARVGNSRALASFSLGRSAGSGTPSFILNNDVAIRGSGTFTVGSNIVLDPNGNTVSASATGTSALVVSGTIKVDASTFTGNYSNFDNKTLNAGSTVEYNDTGNQTISNLVYSNLSISGSGTKTLSSATTVNGNLIISSGTTLDTSNGNNYALTVGGNWTNGGTFTPRLATVTFNGTGTQTLISGGTGSGKRFYNLIHSGTGTLRLSTNGLVATHDFTNSAGTFDLNGQNWIMTGATFSNDGGTVQLKGAETITGLTQDIAAGTWTYTGDNSGSTIVVKDFGATDYFNIEFKDYNSSRVTFSLGSSLDVAGTFTINQGTFNANDQAVTVTGLTSVSGEAYYASTAIQTFNGGLTINGGNFVGSSGDVDVNGDFYFSGSNFTAPLGSFTVSGDWDVVTAGGSFDFGTGTVIFDGTDSGKTITTSGRSFYNLTFDGIGSDWTLQDALSVSNTLALTNGTLDVNDLEIECNSLSNSGIITTSSGDIYITSEGDIAVGVITNASGWVTLISNIGFIIDGNDTEGVVNNNVIANSLVLSAAQGIGAGDALETQVSNLAAQVTDEAATGNIEITDSNGSLYLNDVTGGWGFAVKNFGSGNMTIIEDSSSAYLYVNSPVISNSGDISLTANGSGDAYIEVNDYMEVSSGSGSITLKAINNIVGEDIVLEGDSYYSDDSSNSAELRINSAISTVDGDIILEATNEVTRNIFTDETDNYFYDEIYNYAYVNLQDAPLYSATGDIAISASNIITTNINKEVSEPGWLYEYDDYSYNEAEVNVSSFSGETISTSGNIEIFAINTITRDITADHIGDYDYNGGFYDYSYNYAYLNIQDTLDVSLNGESLGFVTLSASNTVDNIFNVVNYISEYYREYYEDYSNYAEVYVSNYDIYSDSGDITLTAKNDTTQSITADYIDSMYDYTDNEAYIYLYSPIYSQTGNVIIGAFNITDTTVTVTADGDGGIEYYYDDSYNYSYVDIEDVVSTAGNIEISVSNIITRDMTADYVGYFDDELSNYAYFYAYDTLTTAQVYDGEEFIDVVDGDGEISLKAENDDRNNFEITGYAQINSQPYSYAYVNLSNAPIYAALGDIIISAYNAVTVNLNEDAEEFGYLYEYYDYSYSDAEVEISSESAFTISTSGNIEISAANNITRDVTVDYVGEYNGESYEGGFFDYSYNYAYLDIQDTLDVSPNGVSSGSITLSATNTADSTFTATDYISEFYMGCNDDYNNYAEVNVSNYDIYSDSGDIDVTGKNDVTKNITAGYIEEIYDYSYNEAYVYLNSSIYSQSGNITVEVSNRTYATIIATADGDGGINSYEDNAYSYVELSINRMVSTSGNIDIFSVNTAGRNITADYLGYFEDELYVEAYLYVYDILTTAQVYDGEDFIDVVDGDGQINLTANSSVVDDFDIYDGIYDSYSDLYERSYVYIGNTISSLNGDIKFRADDFSINAAVESDSGDVVVENNLDGKTFGLGDGVSGDIILDNGEIAYLSAGGKIIIGSDTAGDITLMNADFGTNNVYLISAGALIDGDLSVMPDDYDIKANDLTLNISGNIGGSGEGEEIDLDLTGELIVENRTLIAPTDLIGNPDILTWTNNDIPEVSWTASTYENFYISGNAPSVLESYYVVWDRSTDTTPTSDDTNVSGEEVSFTTPDVLGEGNNLYFHIIAIDKAGNLSEAAHLGAFYIDITAPTLTWGSLSTLPNAAGWNNADVTLSYTTDDNLSGVDSSDPLSPLSFTIEGDNLTQEVTVTDVAGNSATFTSIVVKLDKTAPVVTITSPDDEETYTSAQTLTYTATDSLSGVAITDPDNDTEYSDLGEYHILVSATDLAGNEGSASIKFTIEEPASENEIINAQSSNTLILRFIIPGFQQLNLYRISFSNPVGPAYLYHPVTPVDMAAFDALKLGDDAYNFINGSINLNGHEGLLSLLDDPRKKKSALV